MKKLLALILALVMCFSLVACGGDKAEDKAENKPAESSKPAESKDPAAKPTNELVGNTQAAAEDVKWKKEVIFAEAGTAFEYPDPQKSSSLQNTKHYLLTHDRLVYLNPETGALEPMLAKSWDISDDGLTYTFHLRDDVVFHNGEKFTADDVVYSMERGRESSNSQVKNHYTYATYTAVDDYTVKCTLEAPNADLLASRAIAFMGIVNREACEADPEEGAWIGTGLWILEEFFGQDGATWVRNDAYWGESTPTERLTFRHIPEAATRLVALETGEIDNARSIASLDVPTVRDNKDLELVETVSTMCSYVGFNNDAKGPWNDVNFRKALAYAIDYDALIQAAYNGLGTQAKTFWGYSDMFGYAPPAEGYSYNPDLAKEYLAKSSYAGETIDMLCYGATWGKHGVILQDMWAKVGINVNAIETTSIAYSPAVVAGEYQMNCYTFSFPTFGSGINNFAVSTSGSHAFCNTQGALPHFDEISKLLADGLTETDEAKRLEIYAELQELWMDDLVVIPYLHGYSYGGIAKGFEGTIWVGSGEHDFRYVRVPEA